MMGSTLTGALSPEDPGGVAMGRKGEEREERKVKFPVHPLLSP